jgi:hypothetical protein
VGAFDGRDRETRIPKPPFTNYFLIGASTPDIASTKSGKRSSSPTFALKVSRSFVLKPWRAIPLESGQTFGVNGLAFRHFQDGFRQSQALDLDLGNRVVDVAKVVC